MCAFSHGVPNEVIPWRVLWSQHINSCMILYSCITQAVYTWVSLMFRMFQPFSALTRQQWIGTKPSTTSSRPSHQLPIGGMLAVPSCSKLCRCRCHGIGPKYSSIQRCNVKVLRSVRNWEQEIQSTMFFTCTQEITGMYAEYICIYKCTVNIL